MTKKETKPTNPQDEKVLNPNAEFEEKIAELTNDLQRTRADFENFRKQVDIQKQNAMNSAKMATMLKVLPLLDDLERAFSVYSELEPLQKSLQKTISELKLEKIISDVGADFNPDFHDAIMFEESSGDKEVISETLRAGYLYEGEVLRPAMVKVKNV